MILRSDTNTGSRGRTTFVLIGCERSGEFMTEVSQSAMPSQREWRQRTMGDIPRRRAQ